MKRHQVIGEKATLLDVHESNRYRAGGWPCASTYAAAALARSNRWANRTNKNKSLTLEWIDELAESSSVRRTLVDVKRTFYEPSCLERGSAATRTVVRSISPALALQERGELTHISRINQR